ADLKLVAVLYTSPEWTISPQAEIPLTAAPEDPADFARFATEFAARYGDAIDHYQIWDEPNLDDAWGGANPSPVAYAAMLQAGYDAIHSADADATVIAAALAPTTETGPRNIREDLYLRELYAAGAQDFMDAVAAKPYGFDSVPEDRTVDPNSMSFYRMVLLREVMVEHGDGQKAIWGSNWGWNALPEGWTGAPSIWGQVSTDEQVQYTLAGLNRIEREFPWVAGMVLHHWQPDAAEDDPVWGFALMDQQNNPSALLTALREQSASTSATNGLFAPDSPYAAYSGVWTFGALGADVGWLRDSSLSFDFHGSEVALLLREGDFTAYLYPQINGNAPSGIPQDASGNPYIILTSPQLNSQSTLTVIDDQLPLQRHTLTATADRGWDQWVLMGYAVSSGDLRAPYNRQIATAWFTAALGVLALAGIVRTLPVASAISRLATVWAPVSRAVQIGVGLAASLVLLAGMFLTWGDGTPSLLRREGILLALSALTAGVVYIEPGFLLTIVALLFLFVLFFNHPLSGVVLTIFWMPFFLFPVQLYSYFFPMAELLLLVTFVAWLARTVYAAAERYKSEQTLRLSHVSLTWIDHGMSAFFVVAVASLVWTQFMSPALTELRVMFIEPLLLYIVIRFTVRTERQIAMVVYALVVSAFVASVIGLGMYAVGENVITAEGDARRLAGVYGSPNNVALYLGRVIPFVLAAILIDRRRWIQMAGAGVLAVLLLTFALTHSVGGLFIGLPFAVAAVLLARYGRRAVPAIVGLAVAGGIAFAFLAQFPRFGNVLDFTSGTNFRRIRVWQSGINVIRDYPITGLGMDQFLYAFRSHYILPDAWQEPDLSHPHNILLDVWTRLGLVGVIVVTFLIGCFWQAVTSCYRQFTAMPALLQIVLIGCMGSMVNLLAHGMVDNSIFVNDLAIVFVVLLALPQQIRTQSI
ncbi:MAG: O-antigen ligase family protein, partial [Chloroflexota bacterium]